MTLICLIALINIFERTSKDQQKKPMTLKQFQRKLENTEGNGATTEEECDTKGKLKYFLRFKPPKKWNR